MKIGGKFAFAAALAMMCLASATSAAGLRRLDVPSSVKWQHAATALIVPQTLAGMARTEIADATKEELDVFVQFGDVRTEQLTLYIFRPSLMSVPVWFDRAESQILSREVYGNAVPSGDPVAYPAPASATANALRRVYKPGKAPMTATGVAVQPLGDWLVVARLSSQRIDPAALEQKLVEALAGLGWPPAKEGGALEPAVAPVQPCADPLAFAAKAKMRKPDTTSALLAAALISAASDPKVQKTAKPADGPSLFCREGAPSQAFAAYRVAGSPGYVIALGDAGHSVSVDPEFRLDNKKPGYAVTYRDLAVSYVYPAYDKLPAPAAVVDMLGKAEPISSSSSDGKNITIGSD